MAWDAVEKGLKTPALDSWYRVVVGSSPDINEKRWFAPDYFDTIIVDEAHTIAYQTAIRVLAYFNQERSGVTATPDRGDMKNLGSVF